MSNTRIFTEKEKEEIIHLYSNEKMGSKKIGAKYGCSAPTILRNIKQWGIPVNKRKIDLTNQRFGKLIVLKEAEPREDKYTRWVCQCDCGNICEVRTDYLNTGHTKSCGCEKKKHFYKLNLTGQKFGYLTVLGDESNDSKKCQCDCGNIIIVKTYNLMSGNTKSCGCYQKEQTSKATYKSLVGQRFGKLVVLERVENDRFKHVNYKCKCDCGGIAIVDAGNLRRGTTNSCGCLKSKGEMLINNWLQEHDINFIPQYSHEKIILESGRRPFFDFAILNNDNSVKYFIEYNGEHHYHSTGGWNSEENFKINQNRDIQKQKWCQKLNIPLYIIRYDDDIFKVLENIIKLEAEAPDMEEAEEFLVEV